MDGNLVMQRNEDHVRKVTLEELVCIEHEIVSKKGVASKSFAMTGVLKLGRQENSKYFKHLFLSKACKKSLSSS